MKRVRVALLPSSTSWYPLFSTSSHKSHEQRSRGGGDSGLVDELLLVLPGEVVLVDGEEGHHVPRKGRDQRESRQPPDTHHHPELPDFTHPTRWRAACDKSRSWAGWGGLAGRRRRRRSEGSHKERGETGKRLGGTQMEAMSVNCSSSAQAMAMVRSFMTTPETRMETAIMIHTCSSLSHRQLDGGRGGGQDV